ncbi:UDP-N-acetylenolpyruvoylglucosamine reductase [Candidatus Falkowbacteria bacterium CG11_big_fil_rev_8_21_14_0_20_39_10]|uniref:UDP-N-acetylenolpyruvoylglucosamine reductase n=1 Tax=Candidatus Falkowbacteria bacterium CG11_big_fil_rev_8_21_14_0_20_39_10 TaxID=1974570 RepID=A0A2M6K9E8_9BACT|nr:MAG: UDP-N-acetylenolpyruvoylglucosamine reductase [Candidatus Falkowbacteria bacterium CG11_big_fil_rev_8_21_14_0_20_39_10]
MDIQQKIKQNIPLAPLTTFKIGGPAKFFIEIKSKEDLAEAYEWAKKEKQAVFILGGGSNLLINDQGVDGLVIKMKNDEIKVQGGRLNCGAGAILSEAVRLSISHNLSGLEWAQGIPQATIGGTIRGNAGAFGEETKDIVETVEVFNIKRKNFKIFSNKDCKFEYRGSVFKKDNNLLVWNAILRLHQAKLKEIDKKSDVCMTRRNQVQPKLPSAGCVFKNLLIEDLRQASQYVAERAEEEGVVKGGKIGVGWLIDLAGLKGKNIGGAKVSLEHANYIVNTGKATAEDVIMLISYIKQQIRTKFKVQLQEEVQYLGFD